MGVIPASQILRAGTWREGTCVWQGGYRKNSTQFLFGVKKDSMQTSGTLGSTGTEGPVT